MATKQTTIEETWKLPPPQPKDLVAQAVLVFAVIYEWVLVRVPDDEPLKGITYVGQAVRGGYESADKLARKRWKEEEEQANREDKELGLIAAINRFGVKAFDRFLLEEKYGDRDKVQDWANEREIALIAERGGILRDMEPEEPLKQTLNLTKGGKGDPRAVWEGVEARSARRWNIFKEELELFVQARGSAHVPTEYTNTATGYRLGGVAAEVRNKSIFLTGSAGALRRAWLNSLNGWTWMMIGTAEFTKRKQENGKRPWTTELRMAHGLKSQKVWNGHTDSEKQQRIENITNGCRKPENIAAAIVRGQKQWYGLSKDERSAKIEKCAAGKRTDSARRIASEQVTARKAPEKRARLEHARIHCLPYQKFGRIEGNFYESACGRFVGLQRKRDPKTKKLGSLRMIGPMVDPPEEAAAAAEARGAGQGSGEGAGSSAAHACLAAATEEEPAAGSAAGSAAEATEAEDSEEEMEEEDSAEDSEEED